MNNGYKEIYMPLHPHARKGGCVYEHILIAERKLGRQLSSNEVVHHINRIRNDNRPENLIVFHTNADHVRFHKKGNLTYLKDGTAICTKEHNTCVDCGAIISAKATRCYTCENNRKLSLRGVDVTQYKNLTKDKLETLLHQYSKSAIASLYNVSEAAIRKMCRKYQISN